MAVFQMNVYRISTIYLNLVVGGLPQVMPTIIGFLTTLLTGVINAIGDGGLLASLLNGSALLDKILGVLRQTTGNLILNLMKMWLLGIRGVLARKLKKVLIARKKRS